MTHYPVFVPIYYGGGRRGQSPKGEKLAALAIIGAAITGYIMLLSSLNRPKIQMKITPKNEYAADVNIRSHNYPRITKISNQNMDCLERKGYAVREDGGNGCISSISWYQIAYLEADRANESKTVKLSKEKFLNDCKECDIYTEIIYGHDTIFGNEKQVKKKLRWTNCYEEEPR
jgi:hypothetical protein